MSAASVFTVIFSQSFVNVRFGILYLLKDAIKLIHNLDIAFSDGVIKLGAAGMEFLELTRFSHSSDVRVSTEQELSFAKSHV